MTRARELSKLGNPYVFTVDSSNNLGIGSATPDAKLDVAGIVSATSFSGDGSELTGITAGATLSDGSGAQRVVATSLTSGIMTAAATDADLSWNSTTNTLSAPTLSGNITGTAATFTGNVSVGGTLTYDDVTNVDSVGVVTARSGIKVGAGESISPVSGTLTYYGDGSNLTGVELGTKNFVASGTIANGATVVINTDGTVGIVTQTTSSTPSAGISSVFESNHSYFISSAYDIANGKVIVAYKDYVNAGLHGKAVVGTVTGTGITFGPTATFASTSVDWTSSTYDSINERVVIAYNDSNDSTYGKAIVGTVDPNNNTISFGSTVTFNSSRTFYFSVAYVGSSKVVVAYRDYDNSGHGTAIVGTVNGTSISFGTPVVYEYAESNNNTVIYDSGNDRVVISYSDWGNSYYGTAIVGEVVGTAITFGSPEVFDSGTIDLISAAYDSTEDKVVIAYREAGGVDIGKAIVGTVDLNNTTIGFGNSVVFNSASIFSPSAIYDSTNEKVVISYIDYGNSSYATVRVGTVSGTGSNATIGFGNSVVFQSFAGIDQISAAYDITNDKTVIAYRDGDNSNYGTAVVLSPTSQATNLTSENYIGIAGEAISNAATGKISVVGGVNSGQSGLTTAQTYYVQVDGTLTTTADTPSVVAGTSISDTKILVWRS